MDRALQEHKFDNVENVRTASVLSDRYILGFVQDNFTDEDGDYVYGSKHIVACPCGCYEVSSMYEVEYPSEIDPPTGKNQWDNFESYVCDDHFDC